MAYNVPAVLNSYNAYKRLGNLPRADESEAIAVELGTTNTYLVTGQDPDIKPHLNSVKAHLQQALTELDRI